MGRSDGFECQRFAGAEVGADRIAAAKVALDNHVMLAVEKRTAKGTGSHTGHAPDALFLIEFDSTGFRVQPQGVDQA